MTVHLHDSRKISEVLTDLARNIQSERVKLADLVSVLGDRAFAVTMFILALPNAVGLGTIPFLSTVIGIPQVFVALQMMIGKERPWLPHWLLERSIARSDFQRVVEKAMPYLAKCERVLRPRWPVMSSDFAERVLGGVFVILSVIVSAPIPFGNQPPAVGVALISLGLIERDGLFVCLGLVASVIAIAIALVVIGAGTAAIWLLFTQIFGG